MVGLPDPDDRSLRRCWSLAVVSHEEQVVVTRKGDRRVKGQRRFHEPRTFPIELELDRPLIRVREVSNRRKTAQHDRGDPGCVRRRDLELLAELDSRLHMCQLGARTPE